MHRRALVVALAGGVLVAACAVAFDESPASGEAVVHWTIEGRLDASGCARHGAESAELRVADVLDRTEETHRVSCDSLAASVVVHDGWHQAHVTLLDADGAAISTTRSTGLFYVVRHRWLDVEVDFPASSFYESVHPLSSMKP